MFIKSLEIAGHAKVKSIENAITDFVKVNFLSDLNYLTPQNL